MFFMKKDTSDKAKIQELQMACEFLMNQLRHLALIHWPEDEEVAYNWLDKNDAMNAGKRALEFSK